MLKIHQKFELYVDWHLLVFFTFMTSPPPSPQALPLALKKLGPTLDPALHLPWDTVRDALDHMAQAAANHVDKEHFLVLWEALQVRPLRRSRRVGTLALVLVFLRSSSSRADR